MRCALFQHYLLLSYVLVDIRMGTLSKVPTPQDDLLSVMMG